MMSVLAILVVALAGCGIQKSDRPETKETIKIGAIESLTGVAAYTGNQTRKGIEVAEQVVKQKYPDLNFIVVHEDSFYTPKGGVDAYQKLRNVDAIDAVITHSSPVSMAVKPLAAKDNVLQMAVSASASSYSSPNDLSFRTSVKTDIEAKPMAEFIKKSDYKKIVIIYFNNDIGLSITRSLESELQKLNSQTQVILDEAYPVDTADFRTMIQKIKSLRADAVYAIGLGPNLANIAKQAKTDGLQTQFLGFRATEDNDFIKAAGTSADGFIYTYNFNADSENPETKIFVETYTKKFGELPEGYAAEGYEGMMLLAEAFASCHKDNDCLKSYLSSLKDHPSIFGPLSVDQNSDISYDFFLKTITDGKFVPYK